PFDRHRSAAARDARSLDRIAFVRLLAISDLHLAHGDNRAALDAIPDHPDDWLIVAGDTGERAEHLDAALETLSPRFRRIVWVPGNHDLWCPVDAEDRTRGQARYDELVAIARARHALTPEDPYERWPGEPETFVVPMFLLFGYPFCPPEVGPDGALEWARQSGIVCGDEHLLDSRPWPSRTAWCHARCDATEARLEALPAGARTVLINHW